MWQHVPLVLLQHLFLQYFCSTVVGRHLVLWQHQGSFHGSTVAALYRVQYCCSTAPCAIAAPWCYCSTLVLLQHRKTKKKRQAGPREKQERKESESSRNSNIENKTTHSSPKGSRQGLPARAHSHPPLASLFKKQL